MIEISNVSKWYGDFQVLRNCTTSVAQGEVVVVCGPSGSGKSTLIKCVNALEDFQEGTITVDGISVGAPKTDRPKLRCMSETKAGRQGRRKSMSPIRWVPAMRPLPVCSTA